MQTPSNALTQWLALTWERPERSYNPDLRAFLSDLLGYPRAFVVTEDRAATGYPDIKLLSDERVAWVVGDLKPDDGELLNVSRRTALWRDKCKYVDGLTRYVIFMTAHFIWVLSADGAPVTEVGEPLDLRTISLSELRNRLGFLRFEAASHAQQWREFVDGRFPFVYLKLDVPDTLRQLRRDLRAGFQELTDAATRAMTVLGGEYKDYLHRRDEIERDLVGHQDTQRRARVRIELDYSFVRRLFGEAITQFEEQYGRDIESSRPQDQAKRVQEAFVADSAATLIARVLFLRLIEDLNMQPRRLSNGGPRNWATFVKNLTGDARSLVRLVSEDMARVYQDPFVPTVFDWIQHANGELDVALQRLILRLNAYDFAGLSEEILGDIYQQFLPPAKRKRLGEFYTPPSIVEWILDTTVRTHGLGRILDPGCGSGSFLVQYVHSRLEDARSRRLDLAVVCRELQAEVWGFDLNPFAAFISLFQMIWAMLRFDSKNSSPHIEIHNLNSLLNDSDIERFVGADRLPPGAKARDSQKWKYVLGNPPYIRAERIKYGAEMRELWGQVWGQNADTGLVFLYRALTQWLEAGGFLGMVVSGGYANSETAGKVWHLLHPGQLAALRKVVWLEFVEEDGKPSPVWEVSRVPMILVIERSPASDDDEIELLVPTRWPSHETPARIKYSEFFDFRVNPRVTNGVAPHGDYLLPLVLPSDIPLLRRLSVTGNGSAYELLGSHVNWTYGIQPSGAAITPEAVGTRPVQVIKAACLSVAWSGEPIGWLDLDAVSQRPNGKLSLWRLDRKPGAVTIQAAQIVRSPFAAVGGDAAALNSVVVGEVSSLTRAKAIALYINSSLARFYWAVKLRSGVLQGYYSQVYPRTLQSLPWPKSLDVHAMASNYDRLAEVSARAKNNPNEWLLAETERRLEVAHIRITEPAVGLAFDVNGEPLRVDELQLDGRRIAPLASFSNAESAEFVYLLLTLTSDEDARVTAQDVQKLALPVDLKPLLIAYRQRLTAFEQVEQDFSTAFRSADAAVYDAFGISLEEREYLAERLNSFPLSRLLPRYPWQAVRPRPIKTYMVDRFA
jgi:hypothetical protein